MLPFHAHFRRHTSPFRERRQVWFSVGSTGGNNPQDPKKSEQPQDPEAQIHHQEDQPDPLENYSVNTSHVQSHARQAAQQIIESNEFGERIVAKQNAEREANLRRVQEEEEERQRKARQAKEKEEQDTKAKNLVNDITKAQENVEKMINQLQELHPQVQTLAEATGAEGVEALRQFERNQLDLGLLKTKMGTWNQVAKAIVRWRSLEVSPVEIYYDLHDYPTELREGEGFSYAVQGLERLIREKGGLELNEDDPNDPAHINYTPLKDMGKRVGDRIIGTEEDRDLYLSKARTNELCEELSNATAEVNKYLRELQTIANVIKEDHQELSEHDSQEGPRLQVQWFTINDLIQGGKNVFQAYKDQWKRRDRRRQAKASMWFGKLFSFMPGSDQVQHLLRQTLEGEERKVQKDFMDYLESNRVALVDLIGTNGRSGLLRQAEGNPSMFMAVVEYMAAHGWLYDFDNRTGRLFEHYSLEIGHTLPAYWNQAEKQIYLDNLSSKYIKGYTDQRDAGKVRGSKILNDGQAIRAFDKQIAEMNYWGAIGVVEGMWGKAKNGHSSALATAMFMDRMRAKTTEGRLFRKYFPYEALDQTSFAIQSPAYIPTLLKFQKDSIRDWRRAVGDATDWEQEVPNNPNADFRKAGNLAETMSMLEDDIRAAQVRAGKDPNILIGNISILEAVSRALSGQILKAETFGWDRNITVFESKYANFRTSIEERQANMDPNKADPTYYKPDDGGSEAVFMKLDTYLKLLNANKTGSFEYADIPQQMLEQILLRDQEFQNLKPPAPEAYENFKREVGGKLNEVFILSFNNVNSVGLARKRGTHFSKDYVLSEFFKRGLVVPDVLIKMLGQTVSYPLAIEIIGQLKWTAEDVSNFLRAADGSGNNQLRLGKSEILKAIKALFESNQPFSKSEVRGIASDLQAHGVITAQEVSSIIQTDTNHESYKGGPGTGTIASSDILGGTNPPE